MGMFEDQVARIDALEQKMQAVITHLQGGGAAQAQVQQPVQQQPQVQQFGAGLGAVTAQPNLGGFGGVTAQPQVNADMIQQLITPLIQNDQAKAAIIGQMQAMGIQNLPDTRPDQMAELYQRFQQVAQQYGGGGAVQQQAAAPSII